MVDLLNPERSAIDLRDQCVAFDGVESSVSDHLLHLIDGDRRHPARTGIIIQAVHATRRTGPHLPTVGCDTRSRTATSLLEIPSAQPSTILDCNRH